ncbi:MAG: thiamine pyrophosphate-dependent dehydrogenase E1 component subunit alpha [Anaerolineales bacterium]
MNDKIHMTFDDMDAYLQMLRIRRFEQRVLELFPSGLFHGTTHTYIGQEANAVGVLRHLQAQDVVVSNHRCHGHFLAYGGDMTALAAELMGKETGVCGGRGGSQHLHWRNFFANGVLGGTIPIAVGMALAARESRDGGIVITFMGDGTLGEGVVYESLNMAALWSLPVLFVLENNRYAQSTPIQLNLAGSIERRFEAFGLATHTLDTTDVRQIHSTAGNVVADVRAGQPAALILHTYRFSPHSKGDDSRDPEEIKAYRKADPLSIQAVTLDKRSIEELEESVEAEVGAAFEAARSAPDSSSLHEDRPAEGSTA